MVAPLVTRFSGRVLAAVVVGALALPAMVFSADDAPGFVLSDGRRVPLTKSTTEFAVTLKSCQEGEACAARLSSTGHGVMRTVKGAEDSPYRVLQVAEATKERRQLIQQDPSILEVRPVYRFDGIDSPMLSSGSLLVKVHPAMNDVELRTLWTNYHLRVAKQVEGLKNVYRLEPTDADGDEVMIAEAMTADSRVVWAQPNFRRSSRLHQIVPADTFYDFQWHLDNTGQFLGTSDADIDAPEAWAVAQGQDVLVGVFDDSCDVDHEDLRDNYIGHGQDVALQFNDDDYDNPRPKVFDDRHGTSVTGLVVAKANSVGVRGVAFNARFTASRGVTGLLTADQVATGFTFARQENVAVHVNSWGRDGVNEAAIEDAIRLAFTDGRTIGSGDTEMKLGMVVCFSSGNDGDELSEGFSYATMPEVIGVGASNDHDVLSDYSNTGPNVNILAPSNGGFQGMTTTDNDDSAGYVDDGYNVGGFDTEFGQPDLDPAGKYTQTFGGTSAACPVAAGVAALVISANPLLTATDVKIVLEHTCDKINTGAAQYNGITSRSRNYGYGRINAKRAVDAAMQSLTNGNRTWPDRPGEVQVDDGTTLRWRSGAGTQEFLVVESGSPFGFLPVDGTCYHEDQLGCESTIPTALPAGVTPLAPVSCNGTCTIGAERSVDFLLPSGRKYFAIYARSSIGRYSFGVSVDSDGNVLDSGPIVDGGDGENPDNPDGPGDGGQPEGPRVTINVSPLSGTSPLTVQFQGNAISEDPIDESETLWDFDISSLDDPPATNRNASHTYVVEVGEQTFTARLTMKDVNGLTGIAQVMIRVTAPQSDDDGPVGNSDVRIIVGVPGTVDSDVDTGESPFNVELKVDASSLVGTLLSVVWDLGDGNTANSIVVPHTYVNTSGETQVFPVTATVTTTSGSTTLSSLATRLVTVRSGDVVDPGQPTECQLPGTCAEGGGSGSSGCGALGLLPLFGLTLGLGLMRRRP